MSSAPDRFTEWDAAYVLGALSPAERRIFEDHLAGCRACQASVAELAGLPGLLAQVSPDDAAALAATIEQAGDTAARGDFPSRPAAPGRGRRARVVRVPRVAKVLGGAAAAVVLVLVGIAIGSGSLGLEPPGSDPDRPYRVAFVPVAPTAMTAVVDVVPTPQGTQLRVECQYGQSNEPTPGGAYAEYAIYVTDRSGAASLVKTWRAKPNRVMTPSATSGLRPGQIAAVEIRLADTDQTLLRASLR